MASRKKRKHQKRRYGGGPSGDGSRPFTNEELLAMLTHPCQCDYCTSRRDVPSPPVAP